MSSSVVLIANPAAGTFSEKRLGTARHLLQERGFHVEVLLSQKRGDIERLARESVAERPEILFVMGGDGTFNEAVNGLVHSGIPVGFIPLGTTNVLARELGIPARVDGAIMKALGGRRRSISLGSIRGAGIPTRRFVMMAGAGFDAYTVYRVRPGLKRILGRGAYILSGMGVIVGDYSSGPIIVRTADTEFTAYTVIAGNGSRYGGNFRMTPGTSIFSPDLHVVAVVKAGRAPLLRTAIRLFRGTHLRSGDIRHFRTTSLQLDGTAHIQVDGDHAGRLPVHISIEKDSLEILL